MDARSDIFSLGKVLYELLSGELPFKADHEAAIMYKIVNADAPLVSTIRPEADPELNAVINECLAKEPEDRYQYAREVISITGRPRAVVDTTLIVLDVWHNGLFSK